MGIFKVLMGLNLIFDTLDVAKFVLFVYNLILRLTLDKKKLTITEKLIKNDKKKEKEKSATFTDNTPN